MFAAKTDSKSEEVDTLWFRMFLKRIAVTVVALLIIAYFRLRLNFGRDNMDWRNNRKWMKHVNRHVVTLTAYVHSYVYLHTLHKLHVLVAVYT